MKTLEQGPNLQTRRASCFDTRNGGGKKKKANVKGPTARQKTCTHVKDVWLHLRRTLCTDYLEEMPCRRPLAHLYRQEEGARV